ncbi:HP1 family phage holin [Citrobacter sedlakii]|nr:HP1 family phage holin [Citrobacter sedlakii]MCZ4677080.1 HP1 family phage holin [Citrobacter sedlakii]MDR5007137.1 HP1 family phage holin [Citrobacter sedlakii]
MDKHSTGLAYLCVVIAGFVARLSLDEWGTLTGIVLAVATFFIHRHYK